MSKINTIQVIIHIYYPSLFTLNKLKVIKLYLYIQKLVFLLLFQVADFKVKKCSAASKV